MKEVKTTKMVDTPQLISPNGTKILKESSNTIQLTKQKMLRSLYSDKSIRFQNNQTKKECG